MVDVGRLAIPPVLAEGGAHLGQHLGPADPVRDRGHRLLEAIEAGVVAGDDLGQAEVDQDVRQQVGGRRFGDGPTKESDGRGRLSGFGSPGRGRPQDGQRPVVTGWTRLHDVHRHPLHRHAEAGQRPAGGGVQGVPLLTGERVVNGGVGDGVGEPGRAIGQHQLGPPEAGQGQGGVDPRQAGDRGRRLEVGVPVEHGQSCGQLSAGRRQAAEPGQDVSLHAGRGDRADQRRSLGRR